MRRAPAWIALLYVLSVAAQSRAPDYNYYDSRSWQAAEPAAALAPDPSSAAARFDPGVQVVLRGGTGWIEQIYRLDGALTPPGPGDPETIARGFLAELQDLLGVESVSVFSLPLEYRYRSEQAGLTHLVFRRHHAGIAVFGGEVLAHVMPDGSVLRVDSGTPWPARGILRAEPRLTAEAAVMAAAATLAPRAPPTARVLFIEPGAARSSLVASAASREPVRARLVWFPRAGDAVLAWELYLHVDPAHWYCAVVDAATGELLFSHNLYRDDRPRGSVFRVETAHPGRGGPTVENFTGWPASSGDCPAPLYPEPYRSGPLLKRCWVSLNETAGNNAVACLDAHGNNQCDWRAAHPQAHFEFPFTDGWFLAGDPNPDRQAAVTNLFYWSNVLHDWLYRLGFDEAAGNFQADNFGRGGFGGDAVLADAQDGSGFNNANFATPPDGSAPRLQIFLFRDSGSFLRRDADFDGDVIAHEYTHGLTLRLIGGPGNTNDLTLWQSGALAEGWSDAYAASFTGDPVVGEYLARTPETGIRSVAYDRSPYTFGRFGNLYRRNIGPLELIIDLPQVHRDGEIWATVLWDLRAALGKPVFETLITTALKLTPVRPSLLDARNAILQAAQALGTPVCSVWAVFAGRGFGASAAVNPIQAGLPRDTALSVFESFDRPPACGGTPPASGAALFADDVESGTNGWAATGLWHRTTRRAASGAVSWWFGQAASGNYATGTRATGALTSPPIALPAGVGAILEWDQFFRGEGFGRNYRLGPTGNDPYLNFDSGWVLASRDGGSTWDTLTTLAHNSSGPSFDPHRIDLSGYAGNSIRLRFLFDTLDGEFNGGEGWFIDNVRLRRLSTGSPALGVSPVSLSFVAVTGGPHPPAQSLRVANLDSGRLDWTATASSSGWLAVSPASGSGEASLTVTARSSGLGAGVYQGQVTVTAPGAAGSPVLIPVTLSMAAPAFEWRMEETRAGAGAQLADASGNARHGTTAGPGSAPVAGVSGNARAFNGATDWVQTAGSPALSPASFTVRLWARLLAYPAADGWGVLISNYGGNYQGWYLGVHGGGRVILSVAGLPSSAPWLVSSAVLQLERWYCITATYEGGTKEGVLYINGAAEARAVFPAFTPQSALPLTLARASWYDGYYLNAAIDEVRLIPFRQTLAEVHADFLSFPPGPPPPANPGLVSEWRMEDPGSTLADASGNGRHGTIAGGTSAAGVRNLARAFDGIANHARVPAWEAFHPASFTARAWVKLLAYPSAAGWGVVLSAYGGNYQGWYFGVQATGRVIFSVASLPASSPWLISAAALSLNRWHHVAVTYHASARLATIYVDGAISGQAGLAGFTPSHATPLYLARASWYDGYYLNAALDEVRIWPGWKTPGEISADYSAR